ncbi:MAG TPA: hypothetical protein EYP16_03790 [Candidatus Atribacteria bacterium]|nr:hypothetical protein [Candidatus Atribacteria bacterium]
MSKRDRKGKRKIKVLFLAILLLIALAMSLFFLQPLSVINVKAEYEGAHIHFIGGTPHICLIFKVQNPRTTAVTATVEIDLSSQRVPASRVLIIVDENGNKLDYSIKNTYKISLVLDLSGSEVKRLHVFIKRS